jgi:hypothetical protein
MALALTGYQEYVAPATIGVGNPLISTMARSSVFARSGATRQSSVHEQGEIASVEESTKSKLIPRLSPRQPLVVLGAHAISFTTLSPKTMLAVRCRQWYNLQDSN